MKRIVVKVLVSISVILYIVCSYLDHIADWLDDVVVYLVRKWGVKDV
jgi:hypothetical protein